MRLGVLGQPWLRCVGSRLLHTLLLFGASPAGFRIYVCCSLCHVHPHHVSALYIACLTRGCRLSSPTLGVSNPLALVLNASHVRVKITNESPTWQHTQRKLPVVLGRDAAEPPAQINAIKLGHWAVGLHNAHLSGHKRWKCEIVPVVVSHHPKLISIQETPG